MISAFSRNEPQQNLFPTPYATRVTGDLAPIQTVVSPYRAEWEQVSDQTVHHVPPDQAGLSSILFGDLAYGYCPNGVFYLLVPKILTANLYQVYGYRSKPDTSCHPEGWSLSGVDDFGGGWFSAKAVIRAAP